MKKVQSKKEPLSQYIAEVLSIAIALKKAELVEFCKKELTGWSEKDFIKNPPPHRTIECFMSFTQINMNFIGWNGNVTNILSYMEANPDEFKKRKSFQSQPISELESYDASNMSEIINRLIGWQRKSGSIIEDAKSPDAPVFFYARGTSFIQILEKIRSEFTRRLLLLLPVDN